MKIPNQIKVGGAIYQIKKSDHLINDDDYVLGYTDVTQKIINLTNDVSTQMIKQTFMHELMHATMYEAGLDDYWDNEQIVNQTALVLYQVINDNASVFE